MICQESIFTVSIHTIDILVMVSLDLEKTLFIVNLLEGEHFPCAVVSWHNINSTSLIVSFGSDPMFVIISEWVASIFGFVFKWQWIVTFEWLMIIDFTASQAHIIDTLMTTSFYSLNKFIWWTDWPFIFAITSFEFTVFNEESTHSGAEVLFPPMQHFCILIHGKPLSSQPRVPLTVAFVVIMI